MALQRQTNITIPQSALRADSSLCTREPKLMVWARTWRAHFCFDLKKPLAPRGVSRYNGLARHPKAGRGALPTPHGPMQETDPPTQQNHCATPIIPACLVIYKGEKVNGRCCVLSRCRERSLRRFCVVSAERPGAGAPRSGSACRNKSKKERKGTTHEKAHY